MDAFSNFEFDVEDYVLWNMEYVFRILNQALRYNDGNINSDVRFEKDGV